MTLKRITDVIDEENIQRDAALLLSDQPWKEVYCQNCGNFAPLIEEEPRTDHLNPWPWYDLVCGRCRVIVATVRIVKRTL